LTSFVPFLAMKKKILLFLIPLILIAGLWGFFQFNQSQKLNGLNLVPNDALYILETDQPIANWTAFSSSEIWQILKHHPSIQDLTVDADYLDSIISNSSTLFSWFDNRSLIISAHKTQSRDYDFLFVVGLSSKAKESIVLRSIEQLFKAANYTTSTTDIENTKVLTVEDGIGEKIHFAQIDNQLICSYTLKLVSKSIYTAANKTSVTENPAFISSYKRAPDNGLYRLYLPYSRLDDLLSCYFDKELKGIARITNQLQSSKLYFRSYDDYWTLDGFTSIDSSSESYIRAFHTSGESDNTVGDVLSNRAAWALSFNFKSFDNFKSNLLGSLQETAHYDQYQKQIKQLETLLGISVERDLTSWIGDEITVAQLRKNLDYNTKENAVVLIKSSDIADAQQKLSFVAKQVKKRTPAMFKQIDYRNYQIQYLEIKGFFKLFFGNSFDKITKPYYTTIGDYVVFSNSPYTLIGMIEDYENQRCLASTRYYQEYEHQSINSSIRLYVSLSHLHPVMTSMVSNESKETMRLSKPYFEAFESFGVNLVAYKEGFITYAFLLKTQEKEIVETIEEDEFTKLYKLYALERDINNAKFVLEYIEDGIYKRQFPGSDKIQIEAETTRGVLDGDYTEYFENGEKKSTGKYKMGRKKGTWKIYNPQGKLEEKKKY
jgi:antitoxin component YwqK of YwqJK toxin-antitoxin module